MCIVSHVMASSICSCSRPASVAKLPARWSHCHLAVVQNSLSGIWPTLAKKRTPFASSFAKLSRSPFSHVGHLGYQPFRQHHRKLSRKHVSSLAPLKAQMPHALNSQTLRTSGIKDGSVKTMACKAGGLLGLRDLSRTFRGSFTDLSRIFG